MRLFKPKKELDSKSKHISVMYLCKAKTHLEIELKLNLKLGENEKFTIEHDIKCLENAINYLNG